MILTWIVNEFWFFVFLYMCAEFLCDDIWNGFFSNSVALSLFYFCTCKYNENETVAIGQSYNPVLKF